MITSKGTMSQEGNMYLWKCEDCGETDTWVSAIIRHCDEQGHGNYCAEWCDDDQDNNETPIGLHGPECSTGKCRACNVSNRFSDY